jgi:hypothetical protein
MDDLHLLIDRPTSLAKSKIISKMPQKQVRLQVVFHWATMAKDLLEQCGLQFDHPAL